MWPHRCWRATMPVLRAACTHENMQEIQRSHVDLLHHKSETASPKTNRCGRQDCRVGTCSTAIASVFVSWTITRVPATSATRSRRVPHASISSRVVLSWAANPGI